MMDRPRIIASGVLTLISALFAYALTTRTTISGAPRYYPPTEDAKRAYARLAERRAAAAAAASATAKPSSNGPAAPTSPRGQ